MDILFENVNLSDPDTIFTINRLLNDYRELSQEAMNTISMITVDMLHQKPAPAPAPVLAPEPEPAAAPEPEPAAADLVKVPALDYRFSGKARPFLLSMLKMIAHCQEITLEQAATGFGISTETARAFLRNAGRTALCYKIELPFRARWDISAGCNRYTLK